MDMNEEENEDVIYEPQVTSDDPEERKLARQLRIQRRIEAIKKMHEQVDEVEEVVEKTLLEKQMESSAMFLDKLLEEGEEVVSNVKVGNEAREVARREKEAAKRAELLEMLENEAKDAEAMYDEIYSKWDRISKYKDPLDIADSIALQREQCNDLIKQKDDIIKMLREEINIAEDKYVADQETQEDDINNLVKRIEQQIHLMRRAYRREIEMIEDAIANERKQMVEADNEKWSQLQKTRREEEEFNMHTQVAMEEEFMQTFYNARVEHEEAYRKLKIELETEGETLEKELEQLKAACLLNGEKLDYNYNILKKREDENLLIRSQQKRMLNKLQDGINKIKNNMTEYKIKAENTISKLTAEIKKIRNLIFQIEKKAQQICEVNDKRFLEIWELNEEIVRAKLDKILQTDRVIYEQLLGIEWKSPLKNLIKRQNLSSYKEAVEILATNADKRQPKRCEPGANEPQYTPMVLRDILERIAFRSGFLLERKLNEILPSLQTTERNLIKIDNVFDALGIRKEEDFKYLVDFFLPYAHCPICEAEGSDRKSQTDFVKSGMFGQPSNISAHDTHEPSLSHSEEEKQTMSDMRKMFDELPGIVTNIVNTELEEYVEKTDEFSTGGGSSVMSSSHSSSSASSDDFMVTTAARGPMSVSVKAICKYNHPLRIEHVNVYKVLKEFVTAFNFSANEVITLQQRIDKKYNSLSRLLIESDIKIFWEQFCSVFTPYHEELWIEILYGLKTYHSILLDRKKVYTDVLHLRKENFELKHMLKNCAYSRKKPKDVKKKKLGYRYRAVTVPVSKICLE